MTGVELVGQVKIVSPISFLGVGERLDQDNLFVQSMGGAGATFHKVDRLNLSNPASLGYLTTTTFSGGFIAERRRIDDGSQEVTNWSGTPLYFSIGLPTQNQFNAIINRQEPKVKWGLGLDLRLNTRQGYDFEGLSRSPTDPADTVLRRVEGDGSLVQVGLSSGWKYKNVSLGLSAGYRFGSTESDITTSFIANQPGSGANYILLDELDVTHRAFVWNVGVMYDWVFDYHIRADGSRAAPNKYLTLGLTWQGKQSVREIEDQILFSENILLASPNNLRVLDENQGVKYAATWPSTLQFGASYVDGDKWRISANYRFEPWENYDDGRGSGSSNLQNAFTLSSGIAYTPDSRSITSYFEKITYSLGVHFRQDERVLDGDQIEDIGIKLGFSLPFYSQRQVSHLQLFLAGGKIGVSDGYEERYMRFGLSFAFTDNQWFVKRKYD